MFLSFYIFSIAYAYITLYIALMQYSAANFLLCFFHQACQLA